MQVIMRLQCRYYGEKTATVITRGCRSLHLYLGKHEFFPTFHYYENKAPLPIERLSCLYIQWRAYMDAIFKGLWRKCVFSRKKGSEAFSSILSEKSWFPTKITRQLSINDVKMLLLTRTKALIKWLLSLTFHNANFSFRKFRLRFHLPHSFALYMNQGAFLCCTLVF